MTGRCLRSNKVTVCANKSGSSAHAFSGIRLKLSVSQALPCTGRDFTFLRCTDHLRKLRCPFKCWGAQAVYFFAVPFKLCTGFAGQNGSRGDF